MNQKTLFNDYWEFAKSALDVSDTTTLVFDSVDIPHDWLIYDTLNLYENSIGWYRKRFTVAHLNARTLLCFDGVYMNSSVYVNEQWVGEWKYGYSSFEFDITDALVEGENEILVKVVYESPNSRWYSGAGIYRNVWLKTRTENYIETDGLYISPRERDDGWVVEIEADVNLHEPLVLSHTLVYCNETVATSSDRVVPLSANHGVPLCNTQTLTVVNPRLWSPDSPHLYHLVTQLQRVVTESPSERVEVIESITQTVGFRTVVLHPQSGMLLNGRSLKLNGVCEHHDLGALGPAFNKEALHRRFTLLKEMGVNAIRTAHNMPAVELMDLADEMGLLVVSEAFDMWERPKTPFDYARFFKDWVTLDVQRWVMRDRNHPSLIMWSIGNEIYDTHADERGQVVTKMLLDLVRMYDRKENGRVTIGSNYMPWENAQKCADIVKVAGYNYAEKYYEAHHAAHPDWIIYGSETASVVQSRGIYHFPFEQSILADDDEQCSALGNSTTSWGAKSAEACILAERDAPFSLGQFIWTGFDYIGEPTPYHTKNSYFGQLDTATFPKDSYFIYQSAWTDYRVRPMVHIFPYWDFNPGQMVDVRVCSNAPKVALYLNGRLIGTHTIDWQQGRQLVGWWKVPYEVGELCAVAYDDVDQVIATDIRHSFGDATEICLRVNKPGLVANGTDLLFVEINMADYAGRPVENANNRVQVEVTGAGRLLGLDNGDSTDYDPYKGTTRRLFSGKLMAIIASTREPGRVRVQVSSVGMASKTIEVDAVAVAEEESMGGSLHMSNRDLPIVTGRLDEIPLRKIEIVSDDGQAFNATSRELTVRARLYPENTSYTDLEWSVVTDAGIPSNLAVVKEEDESNGRAVTIVGLGDGVFRLRCSSKNGTSKTKLISDLEFTASGLGTAYKDPYGFISAGLYDVSRGDVGNGNERGVATSRDGETVVGFRNIDFGPYGSDTITIPIFALTSDEYALQIWEGMPGEVGSLLVADVTYQKNSKWNCYQAETYKLSKRLRGITSISFVLRQKVHIKGFSFERQRRGFTPIDAMAANAIYGDTYTAVGTCLEGIGNNVTLTFEDFDFGDEGASKIAIFGRSPIDKNTIHIRFSGSDGERVQLVDFIRSDDYETRQFEIERVAGEQQVTFIFLPGSQFDFGWFQFKR